MSESLGKIGKALTSTVSVNEDEYHRILASERRRTLLAVLAEESKTVNLETVAAAVAEREAASTEVSADTVKGVTVTLHHHHLPMLADAGVIEYDPDSNLIVT